MADCPTPHINAQCGDFAKTVLMPGDPKRSEFIAKNFLTDTRLVNDVRGVHGYTGKYLGHPVSVMASGMGMPSIAIYSYELFGFFGVERIIRVGSAGSMQKDVRVRDIVLAEGACTDSAYYKSFHLPGTPAPVADFRLLSESVRAAEKSGLSYHVGNVLSTDAFYTDPAGVGKDADSTSQWAKMGVLAVEMEAAALYLNAMRAGKAALAICTVSDHLITGETTTAAERQSTLTDMMSLALDTAIAAES